MLCQSRSQFDGGFIAGIPGRIIGQFHRLFVERIGHFLIAMANIGTPHAGRTVDQPIILVIAHIDTAAGAYDALLCTTDRTGTGPWLDKVFRLWSIFGNAGHRRSLCSIRVPSS